MLDSYRCVILLIDREVAGHAIVAISWVDDCVCGITPET